MKIKGHTPVVLGDLKQIAYAVQSAGFDPDKCTILTTPILTKDGENACRVEMPDGVGTMWVTW